MDEAERRRLFEIIADVRAAADSLQAVAGAMAEEPPAVPGAADEKTPRLEDVRAVLAAKSRDGYGAQIRELIARHGADRLSGVDPSGYAALLKEAETLGNGS